MTRGVFIIMGHRAAGIVASVDSVSCQAVMVSVGLREDSKTEEETITATLMIATIGRAIALVHAGGVIQQAAMGLVGPIVTTTEETLHDGRPVIKRLTRINPIMGV